MSVMGVVLVISLAFLAYCRKAITDPDSMAVHEIQPPELTPKGMLCQASWNSDGTAECWGWIEGVFETVVIKKPK